MPLPRATRRCYVSLTPQIPSQVSAASDLTATGTILANDANTFAVGDVTVNEADGTMTFTVTRTGTSEVPIAFTWATANGTAVAGQDYTAVVGGTVTFPAGTNDVQTFTVNITDDAIAEGNETLLVSLTPQIPSQVSAASDLTATGTILANDANTFAVGDVTVNEAAGTMTFTVTRTGTSEVPIAFTWATANGTAVAGQDYTAVVGGTVTFPAGTNDVQTFTVNISNDLIDEGTRALRLI